MCRDMCMSMCRVSSNMPPVTRTTVNSMLICVMDMAHVPTSMVTSTRAHGIMIDAMELAHMLMRNVNRNISVHGNMICGMVKARSIISIASILMRQRPIVIMGCLCMIALRNHH